MIKGDKVKILGSAARCGVMNEAIGEIGIIIDSHEGGHFKLHRVRINKDCKASKRDWIVQEKYLEKV